MTKQSYQFQNQAANHQHQAGTPRTQASQDGG